jgi:hypothetical protein
MNGHSFSGQIDAVGPQKVSQCNYYEKCLLVGPSDEDESCTRIHILVRSVRNKLEISIIVEVQSPQEPPYLQEFSNPLPLRQWTYCQVPILSCHERPSHVQVQFG